jgi:ascorbate PTS system EIIB component
MKILAVCGMGFGSSMVLRMTIESVLRELGVTATVATADIGTAKAETADVIVTSSEFATMLEDKKIPVIAIRNYVDKNEMKEKLQPIFQK